jgi:hypothetical protein
MADFMFAVCDDLWREVFHNDERTSRRLQPQRADILRFFVEGRVGAPVTTNGLEFERIFDGFTSRDFVIPDRDAAQRRGYRFPVSWFESLAVASHPLQLIHLFCCALEGE